MRRLAIIFIAAQFPDSDGTACVGPGANTCKAAKRGRSSGTCGIVESPENSRSACSGRPGRGLPPSVLLQANSQQEQRQWGIRGVSVIDSLRPWGIDQNATEVKPDADVIETPSSWASDWLDGIVLGALANPAVPGAVPTGFGLSPISSSPKQKLSALADAQPSHLASTDNRQVHDTSPGSAQQQHSALTPAPSLAHMALADRDDGGAKLEAERSDAEWENNFLHDSNNPLDDWEWSQMHKEAWEKKVALAGTSGIGLGPSPSDVDFMSDANNPLDWPNNGDAPVYGRDSNSSVSGRTSGKDDTEISKNGSDAAVDRSNTSDPAGQDSDVSITDRNASSVEGGNVNASDAGGNVNTSAAGGQDDTNSTATTNASATSSGVAPNGVEPEREQDNTDISAPTNASATSSSVAPNGVRPDREQDDKNSTAPTNASAESSSAAPSGVGPEREQDEIGVPTDDNVTANRSLRVASSGDAATLPCVTREASVGTLDSWTTNVALPGVPCVFGVDQRDEDRHCILDALDGGKYGSFGWCYTQKDGSAWGSCGENCPLFGAARILEQKIDSTRRSGKRLSAVVKDDSARSADDAALEVADSTAKASQGAPALSAAEAKAQMAEVEAAAERLAVGSSTVADVPEVRLATVASGKVLSSLSVGEDVEGLFHERWLAGRVAAANEDGTYKVLWAEDNYRTFSDLAGDEIRRRGDETTQYVNAVAM